MASTMSAPTLSWQDSRSNLRDDSRSALRDDSMTLSMMEPSISLTLPEILPKAKPPRSTSQTSVASAAAKPAHETRVAAEKRLNRELVQASWKFQHKMSPVKVSIEHMLC